MGLFSALGAGLSAAAGFVTNTLNTFAGSPLGSQFLGQVGQLGIERLGSAIGLTPTRVSGAPQGFQTSPFSTFGPAPIGPLGTPAPINPLQNLTQTQFTQLQMIRTKVLGMTGEAQRQALETSLFALGPQLFELTFPTLSRTFRPSGTLVVGPSPSIPASQPFGRIPGDFSGGTPVAFPVTREASFPAPSFIPALFGGAQPASLAGTVMRQIPGIVGGLGLGAVVEGLTDFGGGGGTPMFRATMAGARAQFFRTTNPNTGQDTWFRPAGRPILWSGDLSACKRVNKVARRARRKR